MEFIIVPIIFGLAIILLSIGKLLGRKGIQEGCKAGEEIENVDGCGSCSIGVEKYMVDDSGLNKVAQLGNPNRDKRFIDKLDFKPAKIK
jgi:hypothetical protein